MTDSVDTPSPVQVSVSVNHVGNIMLLSLNIVNTPLSVQASASVNHVGNSVIIVEY